MTERVKIKCDDCKFVDDCVDYGWQWCKKFTQKATEPMTNEEWFDTLCTKEKAEWLDKVAENCCQICDEENRELCRGNIAIGCKFENAKKWEMWLKQPHSNKE